MLPPCAWSSFAIERKRWRVLSSEPEPSSTARPYLADGDEAAATEPLTPKLNSPTLESPLRARKGSPLVSFFLPGRRGAWRERDAPLLLVGARVARAARLVVALAVAVVVAGEEARREAEHPAGDLVAVLLEDLLLGLERVVGLHAGCGSEVSCSSAGCRACEEEEQGRTWVLVMSS